MQQFEQLKRKSMKLEEGMPVLWPKQDKPGKLKVSFIIAGIERKKAYAFTAKVIAFICDGELYVTPNTHESLEIIRNSGYKLHEFYVPFSRGDIPQGKYSKMWQSIVNATQSAPKASKNSSWSQAAAPA